MIKQGKGYKRVVKVKGKEKVQIKVTALQVKVLAKEKGGFEGLEKVVGEQWRNVLEGLKTRC